MTSSQTPAGSSPGGPEQPDRLGLAARLQPGDEIAERWEQLIPAARMNVASPSRSAQSASHVARSRRCPAGAGRPAVQRLISGFVRFRRPDRPRSRSSRSRRTGRPPAAAHGTGSGPAPSWAGSRHGWPRSPRRTGGPRRCRGPRAGHRGSARRRRLGRPARRAHPPPGGGLRVRQRQVPADLRRAVRRLGASRGSGRSAGYRCGTPAADEPQVGPQRPPRHQRQARRAPGERSARTGAAAPRHRLHPQPSA